MGKFLALIFVISVPVNAQDLIFSDGFEVCDCQTILKTSPADGESGVSLTRETIIRFSGPIDPSTVTSQSIYAEFRGVTLAMRRHVSPDHAIVTLFYTEPLPPSARVRVTIKGDLLRSESGEAVDVHNSGLAGGTRTIDFDTLAVTTLPGTVVTGTVYASELDPVNVPLEGVTITVDGHEDELFAVTDSSGNFRLDPAPVGKFFVHIDGRTATNPVPAGGYYPFVGKPWESVAGNEISIGNVYLPLVPAGTLQSVSDSTPTEITFAPSILSQFPDFEGTQITVPADSLFANNGDRGGMVGIAPVAPDRLPGTLPANLQFPLVITVQTNGPTNFDIPAPICFPNMPDPVTEAPLAPGEKSYLFSFNHDVGVWEAIGSMTVSNDGTLICTDPGVGILAPGWHGSGPAPASPPPPGPCAGGEGGAPLGGGPANPSGAQLDFEDQPQQTPNPVACVGRANEVYKHDVEWCYYLFNHRITWTCPHKFPGNEFPNPLRRRACMALAGQQLQQCLADASKRREDWLDVCDGPDPDPSPLQCIRDFFTGGSGSSSSGSLTKKDIDRPEQIVDPLPDETAEAIAQLYLQAKDLLAPYGVNEMPEEIENQVNSLMQQADTEAGGDANQFMFDTAKDQDIANAGFRDNLEVQLENIPKPGLRYFATVRTSSQPLDLRGQTLPLGQYSLFIPRDGQLVSISVHDPLTNSFGFATPYLDPNAEFDIGRLALTRVNDTFRDDDEDNLPDVVEPIYGTDPFDPDTDGDGILDGAEVEQGLDPLGDFVAQTGIIATIDTPGSAVDIDSLDNNSAVANDSGGLTLLDVTSGKNPVEIGYLATPEPAARVTLAGNDAVVAAGTAGLIIVDITDPPALSIRRQVGLGGSATSVATVGGLAYVGTSDGMVSVVDIESGLVLQRYFLDSHVRDLGIGLNEIYALTNDTLYTIASLTSPDGILGSVASPVTNANGSSMINRRLAVGTDRIHAVHTRGYNIFDLALPDMPSLLVSGESGQLGWHGMAANGSGLGIAAVGPNLQDPPYDVQVFDLSSDIADGSNFLTQYPTPGETQAVSIFGGIANVADGANGVQVVNYLPYDTLGQAPLIGLEASFSLVPPEAEEGQQVIVRADVTDDVQVRKVEFFLDEVLATTDGNFPFSHGFVVPLLTQQSTFTVRARATDTGGNTAETNTIEVTILPDNTAPFVANFHPNTGTRPLDQVRVFFSEPIDPATIDTTSFSLESIPSPGGMGTPVPADSVSFAPAVNGAILNLPTPLTDGYYRATVADTVSDLAGNPMTAPFDWEFQIADAVFWISQFNGNWEEGYRWDTGAPPEAGDDVFISVPTGIQVTVNSPTPTLSSVISTEALRVNSTLTVNGTILNNGGMTLAGTLSDAYVLPESTQNIGLAATSTIRNVRLGKTISTGVSRYLVVENSLTLDGAIRVLGGAGSASSVAYLNGNSPYTIDGTGEFYLGNGSNGVAGNANITIGPNLTVRGYQGDFNPGSVLVNQGTFHSDLPGRLTLGGTGKTVTNDGVMMGTGGGSLRILGNWTNNGSITMQDGGTLTLGGTYNNQSTITATNSTVDLDGNFTVAGLGNFSRSGGSVRITGTLDNAPAPGLTLDSTTGSWTIFNGRIVGGVVETLDGTVLNCLNRGGTLDGVTLNGTVSCGASSGIRAENNLTINGAVRLVGSTGSLGASLQGVTSGQVYDGTGEIFFGGGDNGFTTGNGATLGSTLTIRGGNGPVYSLQGGLTINSTVNSDQPGTLSLGRDGQTTVINGPLMASNNGGLRLNGDWELNSNTLVDGGTLYLDFSNVAQNLGTIQATNSTTTLGGEFLLSQLGTFNRTGGAVQLAGWLDNSENLTLDASTGNWVLLAGARLIGGVVDTIDGRVFTTSGRSARLYGITLNGTINVNSSSSMAVYDNLTLNGIINVFGGGGSLASGVNFDTAAPQTLDGTGSIRIQANGSVTFGNVTVGSDVTLRGNQNGYSADNSLLNMGTVRPEVGTTMYIRSQANLLTNQGVFLAPSACTLRVIGLSSNDGTFQVEKGSVIQTETNGFTQSSTGELVIDIGGLGNANHGRLTATQAIQLAGALTVNLVDAYEPDIGNTFVVMTGASVSGTFDTVNGLDIGNGKQFSVVYNAANVTLEVIAAP